MQYFSAVRLNNSTDAGELSRFGPFMRLAGVILTSRPGFHLLPHSVRAKETNLRV